MMALIALACLSGGTTTSRFLVGPPRPAELCVPFASSLNLTKCSTGMAKEPRATDAASCRQLCCDNTACSAWQYCPATGRPDVGGGCVGWASTRCHLATSGAPSGCTAATHWIGESRAQTPPPTPPPTPGAPTPRPPGPSPPAPAPGATRKQGFSGFLGKNFSCGDAEALGLADSWYYTWMENQAQHRSCPGAALEFVPMINGVGQLDDGISAHFAEEWKANNAHYLLGYNEPDPGNGHNHPHMADPAIAARDWVQVQKVAEQLNLTLVSPAISTTGSDDDGVSPWFDQFFGNCSATPGCDVSKIAYIAFHDYQGNATKLVAKAEGLMRRYGKPTWITEFAINKWARIVGGKCLDCNITRGMTDAFMSEVLPALDKSDAVARYVWYSARDAPLAGVSEGNLLTWNETTPALTTTGAIYKAHAAAR